MVAAAALMVMAGFIIRVAIACFLITYIAIVFVKIIFPSAPSASASCHRVFPLVSARLPLTFLSLSLLAHKSIIHKTSRADELTIIHVKGKKK